MELRETEAEKMKTNTSFQDRYVLRFCVDKFEYTLKGKKVWDKLKRSLRLIRVLHVK